MRVICPFYRLAYRVDRFLVHLSIVAEIVGSLVISRLPPMTDEIRDILFEG